ncbi:Fic family protein [Agromyces laixinhei]|uniref:Fic family protein n=1 Tax=Agromyces laixinhei TaxID=2585717 RepID=UPI0018DC01B9|nr:Fic family protein [Agromyces laixinhei]
MNKKYELPPVDFSSELVRYAFEIERLRGNLGSGTTPTRTLTELHALFRVVMSVISARIEGNRTTVYDALSDLPAVGSAAPQTSDSLREISNILDGIDFIDTIDPSQPLTHVFVRELHRIAVNGLRREGDRTPGEYRANEVSISDSAHSPPSHVYVHADMSELLDFANRSMPPHEQMLHAAIAHQRFVWIHPFTNGNGRVSRLFTYAMLRRNGFDSVPGYSAVNPTAVFGNDRDGYYAALEAADDLSAAGTVAWCEFFVRGLHVDLERLVQMQDFSFVMDKLIDPAIDRLTASGAATAYEGAALKIAARREVVKARDLEPALPGSPSQRSVAIRSLVKRGLLVHDERGQRFYRVSLARAPLGQFVIRQLDDLGYLPRILKEDDRTEDR